MYKIVENKNFFKNKLRTYSLLFLKILFFICTSRYKVTKTLNEGLLEFIILAAGEESLKILRFLT